MTVLIVLIAWLAFGLALAVVMIRRGHSPAIWLSLSFFGPLGIFLVVSALDEERHEPISEVVPGAPGQGPVDAVIGLDGSAASEAALDAVVGVLGDRLGSVAVVTVLDFDVDQLPGNPAPRADADARLAAGAARVEAATDVVPERVVLSGKPADALVEYAGSSGADLLVVGTRGHGAHLVLGSTAKALASQSAVPVLLVPGG